MAIDPSIILGIKQPQIQQTDPLEQAGGIMRLKALMGQGELQALQTSAAKREFEDEEAVRSAYRDAGGDATRLRVLLGERGLYKPLQALDKFDLEKRAKEAAIGKDTAQAKKYSTDEQLARIDRGASILSTARDQGSYDAARRAIAISFGPEAAAQMPDQYDPQFVQAKIAEGMTVAQRLADQRAREGQQITMRGQDMTSETARRGQDITLRGQNLTDARARQTLERGRWVNDLERGVQINQDTGQTRPITQGGEPLGTREDAKAAAEAQRDLPKVVDTANRALRLIDEMIGTKGRELRPGEKPVPPHKGFSTAVGATLFPGAGFIPGTDTSDFKARLNEVKGGAFMEAFQTLKGGGQITEVEGQKATQAITRMDTAQSEAEFVRAAREFQDVIRAGVKRAQQKTKAEPAATPKVGGVLTQNPDGSFNYGF